MVIIKEMTSIEYGLDFESLQLLKEDCLRLDDNKLSPIKNMSCSRIHEDGFLKKYRRIVKITKVSMQNSAIKALMYF
jgi:hypothetical protein